MLNKSDEGKFIRLKGVSGHGKNRIRQHGDVWLIVKVEKNKAMLRSLNTTFKVGGVMHHDGRWIDVDADPDFDKVEFVDQ